jgi:hypothetical protein
MSPPCFSPPFAASFFLARHEQAAAGTHIYAWAGSSPTRAAWGVALVVSGSELESVGALRSFASLRVHEWMRARLIGLANGRLKQVLRFCHCFSM